MNPSDRELFLRWMGTSKEAALECRALGKTLRYKALLQDYAEDLVDIFARVIIKREQEWLERECLRMWKEPVKRLNPDYEPEI